MARHKKNITIQIEAKDEVKMTDTIIEKEAEIEAIQVETDRVRQELEAAKRELAETQAKLLEQPRLKYAEEEKVFQEKLLTHCNNAKASENVINSQKNIDNEKITGKFINRRAPGQPAKLTYMKYADDPVKWYTFEDGKIYTIPRGFVEQINEYYHTPVFIQKPQGSVILSETVGENSMIQDVDRSNKKYAFVPVNF